ncbi:MAG TPA: hypothetical protein VJL82_11330 [Rhizomicrobium sp.]|nr:hypothetical protein [Rhizomicrobium sp.]
MAKKKLFDDIKRHPARIYRAPADVLRDRRFSDAERLEILKAWQDATDPTDQSEIGAIIGALEHRIYAGGHAAE